MYFFVMLYLTLIPILIQCVHFCFLILIHLFFLPGLPSRSVQFRYPVAQFQQSPHASNQAGSTTGRYRQRFFVRFGHKTTYASSRNRHFSLNHVIIGHTKLMNNLLKHLEILIFKVIFQH